MTRERNNTIKAARHLLESGTTESNKICHAIVEIGKPYDSKIIAEHASLVATYLNHPDCLVRHEAIWYLGSWGHLPEYVPQLLAAADGDLDPDNRAFATRSLGTILRHKKDRSLTGYLLDVIDNEREEADVRLWSYSYSGLLYAWNRPDDFAVGINARPISEVDQDFVDQLKKWTRNEGEMPPITPRKGILASLFNAWRINREITSSTASTLEQGHD
jgi:hypothetical protein